MFKQISLFMLIVSSALLPLTTQTISKSEHIFTEQEESLVKIFGGCAITCIGAYLIKNSATPFFTPESVNKETFPLFLGAVVTGLGLSILKTTYNEMYRPRKKIIINEQGIHLPDAELPWDQIQSIILMSELIEETDKEDDYITNSYHYYTIHVTFNNQSHVEFESDHFDIGTEKLFELIRSYAKQYAPHIEIYEFLPQKVYVNPYLCKRCSHLNHPQMSPEMQTL